MKDLKYWKNNCEEDYLHTPISVLRYITELEKNNEAEQLILSDVSQQRELLVDFWMNLPNTNKNKSVAKHYVDKYLESTNCIQLRIKVTKK